MHSHDAIFKQFLSDIDVARDFLSVHLPPSIRARCDFTTLQLESSSFIDDELRARLSDMLYSLNTEAGKGYIYCVIEHQSRPEKLMAFRLLRYCLAAMQQHLAQGHQALPLVVPLLFYHGKRSPYPHSLRWLDSFENPQLAEQIYCHAFPLIDLTVIPDEEIKTHGRAALLSLVQKHIRTRDMLELAQDIGLLFERWQVPLTQKRALLFYIVKSGNTSRPADFIKTVLEPLSANREELMTIAQQLKQIGYEEGIQQGMKASAQHIARELLLRGMESEHVQQITKLSADEIKQLILSDGE